MEIVDAISFRSTAGDPGSPVIAEDLAIDLSLPGGDIGPLDGGRTTARSGDRDPDCAVSGPINAPAVEDRWTNVLFAVRAERLPVGGRHGRSRGRDRGDRLRVGPVHRDGEPRRPGGGHGVGVHRDLPGGEPSVPRPRRPL
ncbi:hypothetical protein [Nocardiopsis sp. CC223A]|uniref:hypothetical protein n=1 Tax=Nocardiopsis sp. CC223A TaxID=3044051 RepID=UPI00279635BA|nr:hypothetical protein [Nocardiopsis sp. CC223A]